MNDTHISIDMLKKYFSRDAFAALCGIEIIQTGPGFAKTRLCVDKRHLNSQNIAHGGLLFTLADMAFGAAGLTRGKSAVGITTTMSFMKAGKTDVLYAEAREISRSRRLATYTVHVKDSSGDVIALFQGTAYLTSGAALDNPQDR